MAENFNQFLIAELFLAGFVALQSGADSTFLYDTLKSLKRSSEYAKILGNVIFLSTIVLALTNVVGGFIGEYNLRWTLFACLPFVFSAFIISFTLFEPTPSSQNDSNGTAREKVRQQLVELSRVIGGDKTLIWLIIYAGVVLTFNQAGLWLYQPYFELTGISIFMFGIIFASFQVVSAFAGKWCYKVRNQVGEKTILTSLLFISTGASLLLGNLVFTYSFTFIFLLQVVRGFYKILFSDLINRRVESKVKISVLSVQNLAGRMLTAVVMPFIGYFADIYSISQTFTLIAIIGTACGLPVLFALKLQKVI